MVGPILHIFGRVSMDPVGAVLPISVLCFSVSPRSCETVSLLGEVLLGDLS